LIQAAVSRQREFLADASSVQFTRNPKGLIGALMKIASHGSEIDNAHAAEASHMFFGEANGGFLASMMATHPSIPQRIAAIDPTFDLKMARVGEVPEPIREIGSVLNQAAEMRMAPGDVTQHVGRPTPKHVTYAAGLLQSIPQTIRDAAHDPFSARALVYTLLLNDDEVTRRSQVTQLHQLSDEKVRDETLKLAPTVQDLGPQVKLPILMLTLGALRALSPSQMDEFSRTIKSLIEADAKVTLFEYAMHKIISRALYPAHSTELRYAAIHPAMEYISVVLSALASAGGKPPEDIVQAYESGMRTLDQGVSEFPMVKNPPLRQIDNALNELATASPGVKRRVMQALAQCVIADQTVQLEEAELLRAVSSAIDCPLPPFLSQV
jgi:Peptidase family M48